MSAILTPRKLPTQARAKARIQRVLDATQAILNRDGPAAVTTPAIAAESGVSVGSIYQYYPNKEAIILALYEARLAHIRQVASEAMDDGESDWRRFFRKWIALVKGEEEAVGYGLSMSAAFDQFPKLAEIEPLHAEQMAEGVVAQLKRFGSTWPDEALFDLAIYAYYLDAATWRYWTAAEARLSQGVDRLVETIITVLAPAMDGGTPPPPPYVRRRLTRS
ncbi:MAG: TetR/AcrR family transcriptional regulator [Pseudomonadota bacterium]|uniref:TetR/AcrR family transcriptional regulator n=1 Tax=Phenylobacterium sp. TaxID=1871053 RepID=UPI0027193C59|nr:TetR/AcrR family transcriptional regulator [Phenylobacterium sp.]MDO9433538.1 TetR/AcrR family transcriptional regulator [Phenylobacterium sp.]